MQYNNRVNTTSQNVDCHLLHTNDLAFFIMLHFVEYQFTSLKFVQKMKEFEIPGSNSWKQFASFYRAHFMTNC